jgi:hypothetical protein
VHAHLAVLDEPLPLACLKHNQAPPQAESRLVLWNGGGGDDGVMMEMMMVIMM